MSVGHRPVIVKRAVIGTIVLSCKVLHIWSIIKLGNMLYLLGRYIVVVLFETTSICFC